MKGVILAGGTGKRIRPLSEITNKHLLPICDKPMICYPLETLQKIGITKILIITGEKHVGDFFSLLDTGKDWGFILSYASQQEPLGTAAALLLAEDFVGDEEFIVILGDNIVSEDITKFVRDFHNEKMRFKAKILVSKKKNPYEYGVIVFQDGNIVDIIEKPAPPPYTLRKHGDMDALTRGFRPTAKRREEPAGRVRNDGCPGRLCEGGAPHLLAS